MALAANRSGRLLLDTDSPGMELNSRRARRPLAHGVPVQAVVVFFPTVASHALIATVADRFAACSAYAIAAAPSAESRDVACRVSVPAGVYIGEAFHRHAAVRCEIAAISPARPLTMRMFRRSARRTRGQPVLSSDPDAIPPPARHARQWTMIVKFEITRSGNRVSSALTSGCPISVNESRSKKNNATRALDQGYPHKRKSLILVQQRPTWDERYRARRSGGPGASSVARREDG